MKRIIFLVAIPIVAFQQTFGQQPKYTVKQFVSVYDTTIFKSEEAPKNGLGKYYILTEPELWDTDDNTTTHIRGGGKSALIYIEGIYKNGKKNGVFTFYLIDSTNHSQKYKIWEQTYVNEKLNGAWKTYNLKGTLIRVENFKNDSLNGISRDYWIDGNSVMEEREFSNGRNNYVVRTYNHKTGLPEAEQSYKDGVVDGYSKEYYENGNLKVYMTVKAGVPNGSGKKYYEDGKIKEEAMLKDGQFDKVRKYYYPNGKLWIEQEYQNGLPWNVVANYDENGNKRNPGTLTGGNGTLILYNENGSVRETLLYENGKVK